MLKALRTFAIGVFASCLGIASGFAGKPPKAPTTDLYLAPGTAQCAGLTEVTGIYQDGKGTYLPAEVV